MRSNSSILYWLSFGVLALLFLGLSVPGLHGPFLLDDYPVLMPLGDGGGLSDPEAFLRFILGSGELSWERSLARATFVLNAQNWPANPYWFKLTNIILHIVCGAVLFILLKRLMLSMSATLGWAALLISVLWMLNPAQVTTTLYVVQRMTQLATLFCLLSLLCYVKFRLVSVNQATRKSIYLSLAGIFAVLGLLSKENSAVLLLFIPLLDEWLIRNSTSPEIPRLKWLDLLKVVACVTFFTAFLSEALGQPFDGRVFDRWERLAIQGEILARYLGYNLGIGFNEMTIFHDDMEWRVARQGVGQATIWWGLHLAFFCLALYVRRSLPLFSLGVLWFYTGHIIESTIVPLELMFEHRNYFASIGLFIVIASILLPTFSFFRKKGLPFAVYGLVILLIGLSIIGVAYRSLIWAEKFILLEKWAGKHPNSLRAQFAYSDMLEKEDSLQLMALQYYNKIHVRFDSTSMELARIRLSCVLGKPIEPISIDTLVERPFTSSVITQMERLTSVKDRGCVDSTLKDGDLSDLYRSIGDMPLLRKRGRYLALYLDNMAEYFQAEKNYPESIQAREELYRVQPSVATALKYVDLLISGGNYSEARIYLNKADNLNESAMIPRPSIRQHIQRVNKYLDYSESRTIKEE